MILYCVRHGESQFNAEGRIQGQHDVPLSDRGRQQAAALAQALANCQIEAVFSSPLARATQTATALAERCGLSLRIDDRLQEIHAGIFQGLLWSETRQQHADLAGRWLAQEPDFVIPGGESRRALAARGVEALSAIRRTGQARVAVVSHGGLLSASFKALLGVPAERTPFSLYNASINQVRWDDQFRLVTLNQTDHLKNITAEPLSTGDLAI